jgi:hypothetical protein
MVTASNAVWCQRNNVMADRLAVATAAHAKGRRIHRASGSRSSRARPAWAMPKVTTASVGGFRFETRAPFTPTMLAGYPAQATSAVVAAAPAARSKAGTVRLRNAPLAHATPSRYGTSQPARTLIHAGHDGPPRPNRTRSVGATTDSGISAAHAPRRRTIATVIGVRAVSAANTPRNHSRSSTSVSTVRSVAPGTPPRYSPAASSVQRPANTAAGRVSRTSRLRSQGR